MKNEELIELLYQIELSDDPCYLGWYSKGKEVGIGKLFGDNGNERWIYGGDRDVKEIEPNIKIEEINFLYKIVDE